MSAAQTDSDSPPSPVPDSAVAGEVTVGESYYGVPGRQVLLFWSRDVDDDSESGDEIPVRGLDDSYDEDESWSEENQTEFYRGWAHQQDISFQTYPESVRVWNQNNWQVFVSRFSTNDTISHRPAGVEYRDGTYIKDAQVTLYGVANATKVYRSGENATLYIPQTGEVRGFADFRTELPPDDPVGDERTYYDDQGDFTTEFCVIAGSGTNCTSDNVVGRNTTRADGTIAASGDTRAVQYDLEDRNPDQLTYVAEIQEQVEITHREKVTECETVTVTIPTDEGFETVERTECETEWEENVTVVTERMNLTTTRNVSTANEVNVDVRRLEHANGTVDFQLNFSSPDGELEPGAWSTISINGTRVHSGWEYVTWRKPRWDLMGIANGTSTAYPPAATPLTVNAVPVSNISTDGGTAGPNNIVRVEYGAEISSPRDSLPPNVNVPVTNGSDTYRPVRNITIRHSAGVRDGYNPTRVTGNDISVTTVPPTTDVEVTQISNREVKETELTARIQEQSGNNFVIRLSLEDEDGNPVNLQASNRGVITFGDREIETDVNGIATFRVQSAINRRYTFEYKPASWDDLDSSQTPYAPSEASVYVSNDSEASGLLMYTLDVLILPVMLIGSFYLLWKRDIIFSRV